MRRPRCLAVRRGAVVYFSGGSRVAGCTGCVQDQQALGGAAGEFGAPSSALVDEPDAGGVQALLGARLLGRGEVGVPDWAELCLWCRSGSGSWRGGACAGTRVNDIGRVAFRVRRHRSRRDPVGLLDEQVQRLAQLFADQGADIGAARIEKREGVRAAAQVGGAEQAAARVAKAELRSGPAGQLGRERIATKRPALERGTRSVVVSGDLGRGRPRPSVT